MVEQSGCEASVLTGISAWSGEKNRSSSSSSSSFITTGQIPVNLAKAATTGDRQDPPILVTVTAEGRIFVNDRSVADDQLEVALMVHPRESPVLVRADKVTQ